MPNTILIAVYDGKGGYGDFLFALKLAEQMKKYYLKFLEKNNIPDVKLITQKAGKQQIIELQGNTEFGVEVLDFEELNDQVKDGLNVVSVIEGPVFNLDKMMVPIDTILQNQSHSVPIIMMPEYARRKYIEERKNNRKTMLNKMTYQEMIYTGLEPEKGDKGILLSANLILPEKPSVLSSKLDPKIKVALMGKNDIETYQNLTDLYVQYSHDTFPTVPSTPTAERFLEIHRIYINGSQKNQDVVMIGKAESTKRTALNKIKEKLIADGFTKISFYNAEKAEENYLYGEAETTGKHYRVVYASTVSHPSMIATQALSGDLIGATGDQSFGEALSAGKILVYECMEEHKQVLWESYYNELKKIAPDCANVLDLLKNADDESGYSSLVSLFTPEMKIKLKKLSVTLREKSQELAKYAAIAAIPAHLLGQFILNGAISPYANESDAVSPFEKTLKVGHFDVINYVAEHYTSKSEDFQQFYNILTRKNETGSFIPVLREARPNALETRKACYLVTKYNIIKNKIPDNSRSYQDFISNFSLLEQQKESVDALIGLLLVTTKNILTESANNTLEQEKSPTFFPVLQSTLNLENVLKELGVNLQTITPEETQNYYSAFGKFHQPLSP